MSDAASNSAESAVTSAGFASAASVLMESGDKSGDVAAIVGANPTESVGQWSTSMP